jgi:eukaryotic-like serine/threonine-protein kinase
VNFCGNCGALISGVWGSRTEMVGQTVDVRVTASADTLAELLTKATLGEYDIYGELGRGGMAAVYLALDLSLNRKVAIKTMLPELVVKTDMVQRFKREAQTAAGLNHPHVIQIYAVKETKELVYFVMKFIEGRSVEAIAMEQGQLGIGHAQVVLNQVAGALAYAHRKGVVHRDVKPANIMVDDEGWAIVTDFGIAKVQVAQNLTATGTAIGTPTYMSPEQFHNKSITGLSDQYSLGVVAYELLTGRKPFDGGTYAEIITQVLFEAVPDIRQYRPDLPEHITAAINRMLSKDPTQRFPDLDAAAVAIGMPDKEAADRIRKDMISMAKTGPRRTVRMSVPVSPIPMTKVPEPGPTTPMPVARGASEATVVASSPPPRVAPTVPERRPPKPRPAETAVAAAAGHKVPLWAAAAAVMVVLGGFGIWKAVSSGGSSTQSPVAAPQQAAAPANAETTPPSPAPGTRTELAAGPAVTKASPPATKTSTPATPAPSPARITINNAPASAIVTLDGRRQSGSSFTARPGTYQLRIQATGFEPMSQRITVAAGEQFPITFDRREAAAAPVAALPAPRQAPAALQSGASGLATLRLIVQPPATVSIDGANKGQQSRLQEEMVPGTHTVRAEKEGFITKDTVVTVLGGQTATIRLQLTPRP